MMNSTGNNSIDKYLGLLDKLLDKLVIDISMNVNTLDSAAALATVEERSIDEGLDRVLEITIRANICWILASEFQSGG